VVLKGAGRFLLASNWFAVKPSLLPKGTFQSGPSAYFISSQNK